MKKILLLFFIFGFLKVLGQQKLPQAVESALNEAGNNRAQLEKVINYFQADSLARKAALFLVANMPIHYSASYYWVDSTNTKIPFEESEFHDYPTAKDSLEKLRRKYSRMRQVPYKYRDIDSIKGDFLITHIQNSIMAWKSSRYRNIPFNEFCEYILPYRIYVEPLQDWRIKYEELYKWAKDSAIGKSDMQWAYSIVKYNQQWFVNNYGTNTFMEACPRQGPLQLLFRKEGPCEDNVDLQVYALRSQGIPSAVNFIPLWATASGSHFVNTVFDTLSKPHLLDATASFMGEKGLLREPSKVLRWTYSIQQNTLACKLPEDRIPPGFLRMKNYIDATADFWDTDTLSFNLFQGNRTNSASIVYACVFNSLQWNPTWWGTKKKNRVRMSNMTKGVVYLPAYYYRGTMIPAGYPIALGYNNKMILKPDKVHSHNVILPEQEKYFKIRPGSKYVLYMWDNNWIPIRECTAREGVHSLLFDNVPSHALFVLVPDYSQHKERPFLITDEGTRVWW